MGQKETPIEEYLTQQVEMRGGLCEKHTSPGRRGVPDRLITWHGGYMHLVETKAPKGELSALQARDHRRRRLRGVNVFVLWTKQQVDRYVQDHSFLWGH